jgi:hypothetical protein
MVAVDPGAADAGHSAPRLLGDPMNRKRLVYVSRTMLIMLVIAAAVVLGLGAATLLLADPPETSGWLRAIFGRVFGVTALVLGVILGIPSGIGLWAMAGATAEDAIPALPRLAREFMAGLAIATVAVTIIILIVTGSAAAILNLGLAGLVALSALGLGGAVAYSPHRARAAASAVALVVVATGTAWVLRVFLATPG